MSGARFGHVGLTCVDVDATECFYSRYFGFVRDSELLLGETRLVFISAGDIVFELFAGVGAPDLTQTGSGPESPGFRHLALQVPDVCRILADLGEATEITHGPFDLSEHGLSPQIVWIRDPDGRILELYE